jgi:hypothetical protein
MAVYGNNSPAVRFFRTEVPEGEVEKAEKLLSELPPGTPMVGGLHPGGKDYGPPGPGRRRAGPKDLPWKSWLNKSRPGIRKKKRNRLGVLMGS